VGNRFAVNCHLRAKVLKTHN